MKEKRQKKHRKKKKRGEGREKEGVEKRVKMREKIKNRKAKINRHM